jgi:hypothetical protein
LLAGGSGRGVSTVTPSLRGQLTTIGVPAAGQGPILAGFGACVHDRSAATDPTKVPASCQPRPLPGASPRQLAEVQAALTSEGLQANAYNFSRTFSITLWYAAGMLVVMLFGMFGLPRQVRIRGLEPAEIPGGETVSLDLTQDLTQHSPQAGRSSGEMSQSNNPALPEETVLRPITRVKCV